MNKLLGDYDKPLFWANFIACVSICVVAIMFTDAFGAFWNVLQNFISLNFGWFYALVITLALVFGFYLAFTKFGELRLGRDDEKPEYSLFAWVAMLFSAGIGVGVYFWGVAEPMYHFMQTPYMAEPGSAEAVSQAMAITYLHWGMHGWGVYVLAGLAISIAAYRLNKPLNFSSSLYGLFGDKVGGVWGRVLDFFCAFCTVAGLATSIGMGVLSLAYVVTKIFGIPSSIWLNVGIMVVIFILYTFSTTAGIEKGMARVSTINVYLCFGVMIFIFVFGPSRFILNLFVESMGKYINYMPQMTLWQDTVGQTGWLGWWTTFYWAWWLAWVPFVGGFLARISRGRTIREFLLGGLLLPSLILLVWFTVMGGTGIDMQMKGTLDLWTPIQASTESGYYLMLDKFPLVTLVSIIALVNLLTFLVTSADAGSIYVGVLCAKGVSNPTIGMKFICAILIASLPIALIIGGGLKALQTMSMVAAFPFAITSLLTIFSVMKMVKMPYVENTQI